MTGYPVVPLPGHRAAADPAALTGAIEEWVGAQALRDLVLAFGGTPPAGSLGERLDRLDRFSEVWDTRGGGERHDSRKVDHGEEIDALTDVAARSLGLRDRATRPAHAHYRHVLVAGGGVRTCVARSAFAAEIIAGGVTADQVAGLGSLRHVTAEEASHARDLGLAEIGTEFDAMDAGLRRAFRLERPAAEHLAPGADFCGWRVRSYRTGGRSTYTLAAPSTEPATRRANTGDTLRFWAEEVGAPEPGDRVLLVTTDLHLPFQHCDAVRLLGLRYSCQVDTVGLAPGSLADPLLRHTYPTSAMLQEVRSAIRSMRALHAALHAHRAVAAQRDAVSAIASRNASERCS